MQNLFEQNKENPKLKDYAVLLLDQALLAEGSPIEDIAGFNRRLNELLIKDLG
jgi:HSP90 family molecular chaperone